MAELASWSAAAGADLALTTQKDLVKLRAETLGPTPLRALRIGLEFLGGRRDPGDGPRAAPASGEVTPASPLRERIPRELTMTRPRSTWRRCASSRWPTGRARSSLGDLGRPSRPGATVEDWLDGLPNQLAGRGLKRLRDAIVRARVEGRPVVAALGGHVIKTGCAPYLIDWVERGVLNGLAMNGSAAIHDLELAIAGKTSEDVGPRLMAGTFGFARETSELFAEGLPTRGRTRRSAWGPRWATW